MKIDSDSNTQLVLGVIIAFILIAILATIIDKCASDKTNDTNSAIEEVNHVVVSNNNKVDSIKYDIVIINKEKNEAIKISRNLSDSAAVELFKQLVTE